MYKPWMKRRVQRPAEPKPKPFPWRPSHEEGASCPVDLRAKREHVAQGPVDQRHGSALEVLARGSDGALYLGVATFLGWEYYPALPMPEETSCVAQR